MKYKVVIQATITKPIIVEAENQEDAIDMAHEQFNVLADGVEETYSQEVLSVDGSEYAI